HGSARKRVGGFDLCRLRNRDECRARCGGGRRQESRLQRQDREATQTEEGQEVMSIPVHTVQVLDPQTGNDFFDRVILAQKVNVAYGTGTNPTVAVTFTEGLPQSYGVF